MRKGFAFATVALTALAGLAAFPTSGNATYLDLTNPTAGQPNTYSGYRGTGAGGQEGYFLHQTFGGGTGNFPTFAEIGSGGNQAETKGYNTTVNGTFDIGSSDVQNHGIRVGDVAIVNIGGVNYFSFGLDVNENSGGNPDNKYISLDALKLFTNNVENPGTEDLSQLGTLRFDLGTGNNILLNFSDGAGSGFADLLVYIPVWAGYDPNEFIHLYSEFGALGVVTDGSAPTGDYGNSDGYEHWGFNRGGDNQAVPVPPAIVLVAFGLAPFGGIAGIRRLRRKVAA
jgi:hypothetical protein